MQLSEFDFDLPQHLIAQTPLEDRADSRLLVASSECIQQQARSGITDSAIANIVDWISPGDCLVFNDTKVIPARFYARKASGGKLELLIDHIFNPQHFIAQIKASKSPKIGTDVTFADGSTHQVIDKQGSLFTLQAHASTFDIYKHLSDYGKMPLPPYIQRPANEDDEQRYQTVYAHHAGAVAAPTAGLHFTDTLLAALKEKGVRMAHVTLHVGAGTFQPIRTDNIHQHTMHKEWINIDKSCCDTLTKTQASGGDIIAVGTTSLRSLESMMLVRGEIHPFSGFTDLYVTPGFDFKLVDKLLTNFHLPKSSLMVLVSSFSGMEAIKNIYQHAIAEEYRFFSYGDAMLLSRDSRTQT